MTNEGFSHLDQDGSARMVDVSDKDVSKRRAVAKSRLRMSEHAADLVRAGHMAKGDVLQVARIAGIQAAKQTSSLIPLCHIVPLESVSLSAVWLSISELEWTAEVTSSAKTGVEMEALVAASIAALTVYDMCKSIDRSMIVTHLALWEKSGGARGDYTRRNLES